MSQFPAVGALNDSTLSGWRYTSTVPSYRPLHGRVTFGLTSHELYNHAKFRETRYCYKQNSIIHFHSE